LYGKFGNLGYNRGSLVDFFGLDEGIAEMQGAEGEVAGKRLVVQRQPCTGADYRL
jgi:hypothetical protein